MSKTIRQIADELGVSKQAVFYRIKKPPLSNVLQSLTTKIDGVLMVGFDGEALIKQAFSCDPVKSFGDKEPSNTFPSFDGEVIKLLQDNITLLQEQLLIKDRQIEDLIETVKTLSQSINAGQHNALAETLKDNQPIIEEDTNKEKKRWLFWKR